MDQKTIEAYDRTAESYAEKTDDYWTKTPQPTLIELFADALAGPAVLDVGSGPGRDALLFRKRGLKPVCLDASPAMVKLVVEKGLPALRGDFARLPFRDAAFDGVWAYTSLLHARKADIDGPLAEIRRVLCPGGILGLGLMEGACEEYRDVRNDGNPRWFSYYLDQEVHDLLARHAFEITYTEAIKPGTMTTLHFLARKG